MSNELNRIDDVVIFEEDQAYSRDTGTIASGSNLTVGAVLGIVTSNGKYAIHNPGASDGTETVAGVLLSDADAASEDVVGALILSRHARVRRDGLNYHSSIDTTGERDTVAQGLKALGILAVR
jgi:hypothetical protein